ncbi:MAG: PD-(D/E)XK nuclease family protein [Bryobacterales bacterium]|nr:PD-(D/E)XK nuclease family protein [Bryobacterales bacterium]
MSTQPFTIAPPIPPLFMPAAAIPAAATAAERTPRLSPSQVNTLNDCAAKWWYKHALKLADPMTLPLAIGRAVHAGIEAALTSAADPAQVFSDTFDAEASKTLEPAHSKAKAKARAASYMEIWIREAARGIGDEPDIEKELTGTVGGIAVKAKLDILTETGRLIDIKTKYDKPRRLPAAHYLQAITYALLTNAESAQVHMLCGSRSPSLQVFDVRLTPDARRYAEAIYQSAADQIRSGLLPPRRDSPNCSRLTCPYHLHCVRDFGGEVSL